MLSLGVSGLVCFVILVYQSRLSVDPAGRIYFWLSSQFLIFGFPWLNSLYFRLFSNCSAAFQQLHNLAVVQ